MSWLSSLGHTVGKVIDNPITKLVGGGLLAATGVGAPLGAAIMGGAGALGGALKPGGNLGSAASGGLSGAALGATGGGIGSAIKGGGLLGGLKTAIGLPGAVGGGGSGPYETYPGAGNGQPLGDGGSSGGFLGGLQQALGAGGWGQTLLQTAGGVAGGALDARQNQAALDERTREFNQQQGLAQQQFGLQQNAQNYQMANDRAAGPYRQAVLQQLLARLGAQRAA